MACKVAEYAVCSWPFGKLVVLICNCGGGPEFTVSVAALLATLPAELLTTTRNCAPLSAAVVAGMV